MCIIGGMKLKEYIRLIGDEPFAKLIGVSKHAARSYRTGERSPRPAVARKIVKKTPVTLEGIYG